MEEISNARFVFQLITTESRDIPRGSLEWINRSEDWRKFYRTWEDPNRILGVPSPGTLSTLHNQSPRSSDPYSMYNHSPRVGSTRNQNQSSMSGGPRSSSSRSPGTAFPENGSSDSGTSGSTAHWRPSADVAAWMQSRYSVPSGSSSVVEPPFPEVEDISWWSWNFRDRAVLGD